MRLIDADELKKNLKSVTLSNGTLLNTNTVLLLLDKYPTAYDVDKVVEQLEELTEEECTLHECGIRSERCKPCIAKKAIEIVKAGGIDG